MFIILNIDKYILNDPVTIYTAYFVLETSCETAVTSRTENAGRYMATDGNDL